MSIRYAMSLPHAPHVRDVHCGAIQLTLYPPTSSHSPAMPAHRLMPSRRVRVRQHTSDAARVCKTTLPIHVGVLLSHPTSPTARMMPPLDFSFYCPAPVSTCTAGNLFVLFRRISPWTRCNHAQGYPPRSGISSFQMTNGAGLLMIYPDDEQDLLFTERRLITAPTCDSTTQCTSANMADAHKNPDIDMTDEGHKFESALAGPKEDNRPVLGWSLENALKCLRPDIVEAVKKNPGSFLIAVILASEFKDRAGAPEIIQQISLQNGLNFPKVFSAIPIGANDNKFPLPMPWGHFIPDCSSDTKAVALANPVIHGTVNECLYTIYFIDPTPEHPPFLILTYHGLSSLTTEDEIKSAFLTALLSDPFVVNTAHADHSYVPNEPKPEMIFRILVEFAKIRKCAVSSKPNSAPTTAFSIILPPLSTDASQTAVLERHLMRPEFAFNIPLQGTATPWRNSRSLLMSCTECHSVAHYKDDCLITNSDSYKAHYGHTTTDAAWYALNDDGSSSSTSSSNSVYRGAGRGRARGFYRGPGGNPGYNGRGFSYGRSRGSPYTRW
ncbi:hypothetical protein B0H10DRAFT_2115798 [Mycena sp. CBHHK59/15]|nr:hypothetical protein B0H10DRAFT_2115798 [Mycena sp. CBHHK59/15]